MAKKTRTKGATKRAPQKRTDALVRRARAGAQRNRATAQRLVRDIRRRAKRIDQDFHGIGRALRQLSEERLYSSLGYASFDALLKKEKLVTRTLAFKLMAVAEAYPAATARELGVAKAYALCSYAEATPAADLARGLAESDARVDRRRISTASVRHIQNATRRILAGTGRARDRTSAEREARRAARRLQARVRKAGAKDAIARAIRVAGEWRVSLHVATKDVGVLV